MAVVLAVDPRDPDPAAIDRAAALLRQGRVVAYPTDTVYGLAVDPRNADAVARLFALKGRAESSALTLIAASVAQAREVGDWTGVAARLSQRWWPGPLTLVLTARTGLAEAVLAGGQTVGVRVPNHPVAAALARAFGFCVTATSANRSGAVAASTADEVAAALPSVDAVLDGGSAPGGPPSTIVNAFVPGAALIRAGAVPWERVLESLQ